MGLPDSEQRVPGTIENELQITGQQLAGAFAASPFTSGTLMPGLERLTARRRVDPPTRLAPVHGGRPRRHRHQ